MLDYVIRGGEVVAPSGVGHWDIGIRGEKIVALAEAGSLTGEVGRIIDATGKIVVPGGIEPHAHVAAPIMGHPEAETAPPPDVSRAAVFGGTTTVVDFAIQFPGRDIFAAIDETKRPLAGAVVQRFHVPLHACSMPYLRTSSCRSRRPSKPASPPSRYSPPTFARTFTTAWRGWGTSSR